MAAADNNAHTNGQALLEVRNLKTYFPVRKGVFSRTVGYVKAVDDDVRVSPIRLTGAKARNDGAVIVDRGFRSEASDNA